MTQPAVPSVLNRWGGRDLRGPPATGIFQRVGWTLALHICISHIDDVASIFHQIINSMSLDLNYKIRIRKQSTKMFNGKYKCENKVQRCSLEIQMRK